MIVRDTPTKRQLPKRTLPVRGVVVHSTGATDLKRIIDFYTSPSGLQPHHMIAWSGDVYRIVDEDHVAYHAKIDPREADLYVQGFRVWSQWKWDAERDEPIHLEQEYSGYVDWKARWRPRFSSPLDLWTGRYPNSVSVGIELQAPPKDDGLFTDAQYAALGELLRAIGGRHKLTMGGSTMLAHSDVSPMRRCSVRGGSDPGRGFDWQKVAAAVLTENRRV